MMQKGNVSKEALIGFMVGVGTAVTIIKIKDFCNAVKYCHTFKKECDMLRNDIEQLINKGKNVSVDINLNKLFGREEA